MLRQLFTKEYIFILLLCIFFSIENSYSQTIKKNEPITITSNQVEIDNKKRVALYSGNVFVKKGDLSINAQQVEICFGKNEDELKLIKATGRVHIFFKEYEAKAKNCIFNNKTQEISLTGNPEAKQGDNWVKGETITYFLSQERVVVKGDVETIINNKGKDSSYEKKQ